MNEFDIIDKYFVPLTRGNKGSAGLKDDAAVVSIPEGHELVVTSDTLNEGVHFLEGEAPGNIARKALRANLSDLASMAAKPLCYQLNIAFAQKPAEKWLSSFSRALLEENEVFDIYCSGGDTTRIKGEALSISITAMGLVPTGKAVRCGGAKDGDYIVLTGPVGDAALGLKVLQSGGDVILYQRAVERYQIPQPRVFIASIVQQYANAATDISDGALLDCSRICHASDLGAEIDCKGFEFSQDVWHAIENSIMSFGDAISGGDDYELILSVSECNLEKALQALRDKKLNPMPIGRFTKATKRIDTLNSEEFDIEPSQAIGWTHW